MLTKLLKLSTKKIMVISFALSQAILSGFFLMVLLAIAIGCGKYLSFMSKSLTQIDAIAATDPSYALDMAVMVLSAAAAFTLSMILCVGLIKKKPGYIVAYVIAGVILGICQMTMLTKSNFQNFPEDRTVLYVALYMLYIVVLMEEIVKIKQEREAVTKRRHV